MSRLVSDCDITEGSGDVPFYCMAHHVRSDTNSARRAVLKIGPTVTLSAEQIRDDLAWQRALKLSAP